MKWMMLTPREVELVKRPVVGTVPGAVALREVQALIRPDGEVSIPDELWTRIRLAAVYWVRGGYGPTLKALLAAADRHP